jgi:hypothetical protein
MFPQCFDSARNRPADLELAGIFAESNVQQRRAILRAAFVADSLSSTRLDFLSAQDFHRFACDHHEAIGS